MVILSFSETGSVHLTADVMEACFSHSIPYWAVFFTFAYKKMPGNSRHFCYAILLLSFCYPAFFGNRICFPSSCNAAENGVPSFFRKPFRTGRDFFSSNVSRSLSESSFPQMFRYMARPQSQKMPPRFIFTSFPQYGHKSPEPKEKAAFPSCNTSFARNSFPSFDRKAMCFVSPCSRRLSRTPGVMACPQTFRPIRNPQPSHWYRYPAIRSGSPHTGQAAPQDTCSICLQVSWRPASICRYTS